MGFVFADIDFVKEELEDQDLIKQEEVLEATLDNSTTSSHVKTKSNIQTQCKGTTVTRN